MGSSLVLGSNIGPWGVKIAACEEPVIGIVFSSPYNDGVENLTKQVKMIDAWLMQATVFFFRTAGVANDAGENSGIARLSHDRATRPPSGCSGKGYCREPEAGLF